jgi:hypothetical protein
MNDDGHSMPPIGSFLMGGLIALVTMVTPIACVFADRPSFTEYKENIIINKLSYIT